MNDYAYGAEVHMLEPLKKSIDVSLLDNPDLAEVARALGAIGLTVRNIEDLHNVAANIKTAERPVLIDAKINRDIVNEVYRRNSPKA